MMEWVKNLTKSFGFGLVLTALTLLSFTASTINFLRNLNPLDWGGIIYLVVAGGLFFIATLLVTRAYNDRLQKRVNASIDLHIQQHLTDLARLEQMDVRTTNLIRSFLSKTEVVDEATRRVQEIVTNRLANPLTVVRESHRENVYQAFESGARAYGLFYEFQNVHCYVEQNGQAIIVRHAKLAAYTTVSEFYVYLLLPEQIQKNPLTPPRIERISSGHNLEAGIPVESPGGRLVPIYVHQPLGAGDSVEFKLYEGSETQVFRTPWKRKQSQTDDDYVFWDINYPTRQLMIIVHFPLDMDIAGIIVDAVYSVRGKTLSRHVEEYDRVKGTAVNTGEVSPGLSLTVDRPLLAVKYKLGWIPDPSYAEPETENSLKGGDING